MFKKLSVVLFILMATNFVLAFDIEIIPHYYSENYEIQVYLPNQTYDGVSFDIIGENKDNFKVKNITLIEIYPSELRNKTNIIKNYLNIKQKTLIGKTEVMDLKELKNNEIKVTITGLVNNVLITRNAEMNISLNEEKEENLSIIGNSIWEGESKKGLWIGFGIVGLIIFVSWKYKLIGNIGDSMEGYRRKEKYRRMNK